VIDRIGTHASRDACGRGLAVAEVNKAIIKPALPALRRLHFGMKTPLLIP
jgi:hypothetical protein